MTDHSGEGCPSVVIRYEKAGRWYVEPRNGSPRWEVSVDAAAVAARLRSLPEERAAAGGWVRGQA
jgi:hypothetical protein